jgi:hypothetical protein
VAARAVLEIESRAIVADRAAGYSFTSRGWARRGSGDEQQAGGDAGHRQPAARAAYPRGRSRAIAPLPCATVPSVDQLHAVLAWLAAAGALALLGAAILTATRHDESYRLLDRGILVQLGTLAIAAVSGLAFPVSGTLPRDALHFVYAAVGLLVAPAVRYATRGSEARRMGRWHVVAAAIVLGAVLRLFMTGR